MSARVALVVGAGGVLGSALCMEFHAAGYEVVGLRRAVPGQPTAGARVVACNLGDPYETSRAVQDEVKQHGYLDVVICNAAHLTIAPFADLSLEDFETSWRVCVGSTLGTAAAVLPSMSARGRGAFLITGATASTRGTARFSAFAAAKFALRGLAQSLAREYQLAGVHVAHVILDGLLRGSHSVQRFGARDEDAMDPRAVAGIFRQLAEQGASTFTHEIDLRPHLGRF
jgi:NAD(P)-dependent dehydrogenase (short-subunit alcohol dehydrogenase family)